MSNSSFISITQSCTYTSWLRQRWFLYSCLYQSFRTLSITWLELSFFWINALLFRMIKGIFLLSFLFLLFMTSLRVKDWRIFVNFRCIYMASGWIQWVVFIKIQIFFFVIIRYLHFLLLLCFLELLFFKKFWFDFLIELLKRRNVLLLLFSWSIW